MKSFKFFLKEATDMITAISAAERNKLNKAISPYTYQVKEKNAKRTVVVVRAPKDDRTKVKKEIEQKLNKAKYNFAAVRAGGSTGSTDIELNNHSVRITYKPISGGMSETTLNSTITELAPAIAFMANKKFTNVDAFYKFLATTAGNRYNVYVNSKDAEAGKAFIDSMPTSSKFSEKMENAIAVTNYLHDLHKETPIAQVYWGYRAKPAGIPASHKGDLFVKFKNGSMLGVSLKAGGEKTAEPQLNTYVNKLFDDFNRPKEKEKLMNDVHNRIHSKLDLPKNWADRSNKSESLDKISEFKAKNPSKYEDMYDEMLEIVRDSIIAQVNKNKGDALKYIQSQVLKKDENVPLVVVKAVGKKYKYVTDEDAIETLMPRIIKVNAYKSGSSKQNWFIDLITKDQKVTMNMSVRSNKSPPENKIAQGYNLAIKFNGLG